MAYLNVKNLMNDCADPSAYNFEMECNYEDYKALPLFERYLVYKSTAVGDDILKIAEKNRERDERRAEGCYHEAANYCVDNYQKYPNLTDCDGWDGRCKLAVDLYEQLWGWRDGEQRKGNSLSRTVEPIGALGGDTLNSVQTTLNCYLQDIIEHNPAYRHYLLGRASIRFCIQLYCLYGKGFIEQLMRNKELFQFVNFTHRIGNLVLTPSGYNKHRGKEKTMRDYVDLSLFNLLHDCDGKGREYFGENPKERGKRFAVYINFSFLWDNVEKSAEGIYEVLPLCDSHRLKMQDWNRLGIWDDKNVLPKKEELESLCRNMNRRIIRRGMFMTAMLEISMKAPDLYAHLMQKVFLTERVYDGYREVIEAIIEEIRASSVDISQAAAIADRLEDMRSW